MWFKPQKMQKVYKEVLLPILALHLPLSYLALKVFFISVQVNTRNIPFFFFLHKRICTRE